MALTIQSGETLVFYFCTKISLPAESQRPQTVDHGRDKVFWYVGSLSSAIVAEDFGPLSSIYEFHKKIKTVLVKRATNLNKMRIQSYYSYTILVYLDKVDCLSSIFACGNPFIQCFIWTPSEMCKNMLHYKYAIIETQKLRGMRIMRMIKNFKNLFVSIFMSWQDIHSVTFKNIFEWW